VLREANHLVPEQVESPAGASGGRIGARDGNKKRFLFRVELSLRARARFLTERRLEPFFDEAALRPIHRGRADGDVRGDRLVGRSGGRRQKNLRALQPANWSLPALHESPKLPPTAPTPPRSA